MIKETLALAADWIYRLSPHFYYGIRYFAVRKKWPDFTHPTDLSEYLLNEMLKPEFKRFADYADKIKVHEYLRQKHLEHILPKIYGIWNHGKEINFEQLPSSFALKTNHGCGNHIICRDKNKLDTAQARRQMEKLVRKSFSIREPHYPFITPKIYAEELIEYKNGKKLVDYKFMCTKGEVRCILTCSDRSEDFHQTKLSTLDKDWNELPWMTLKDHSKTLPERPVHLKEMIKIAEELSSDFNFVRVDLYDTGDRVLFGELTFTPNSSLLTYFTTEALHIMAQGL